MTEVEKKIFIQRFGKNLVNLRKKQGITQAQLAADADIEISQISRIERGILNTSIGNALNLAQALKVDIKVLFDDL